MHSSASNADFQGGSVSILSPDRQAKDQQETQVLIPEARQRQRRRWLWAVSLAVLAGIFGFGGIVISGSGGRGGKFNGTHGATSPSSPGTIVQEHASFPAQTTPIFNEPLGNVYGLIAPGVGWSADGGGYPPYFITNDAGKHWHSASPPGGGGYVGNIATTDSEHLWFDIERLNTSEEQLVQTLGCDSQPWSGIEATTDGGITWHTEALPGCLDPSALSFINNEQGFALTYDELFSTSDGGEHWTKVGETPLANQFTFTSASEGWGLSQRETFRSGRSGLDPSSIGLWHTVNGGKNWHKESIPLPHLVRGQSIELGGPQFFGTQHGVVPIAVSNAGGSMIAIHIDSTNNAGISWRSESVPARTPFPAPAGTPIKDGWHSVPFSAGTARNWFIALGQNLYSTDDAGHTWRRIQLPASKGLNFTSLAFVSAKFGWAGTFSGVKGGRGPFLQTTDGGKSWTTLSTDCMLITCQK